MGKKYILKRQCCRTMLEHSNILSTFKTKEHECLCQFEIGKERLRMMNSINSEKREHLAWMHAMLSS